MFSIENKLKGQNNFTVLIKNSLTFISDAILKMGKIILFKYSNLNINNNFIFNSISIDNDSFFEENKIQKICSNIFIQREEFSTENILAKNYINKNYQLKYIFLANKSSDDADIEVTETPKKLKKLRKRAPPNPSNFKVTRDSIYGSIVQPFLKSKELKAKSSSLASMKELSSFKSFSNTKGVMGKLLSGNSKSDPDDVWIDENNANSRQSICTSAESVSNIESNDSNLKNGSSFDAQEHQNSFKSFKAPCSPLSARNNLFADIRKLKSQLDSKSQSMSDTSIPNSCTEPKILAKEPIYINTNFVESSPTKLSLFDAVTPQSKFRHSIHLKSPISNTPENSHPITDSDCIETPSKRYIKNPLKGSLKQKLTQTNSLTMSSIKKNIKEKRSKLPSMSSSYTSSLDRSKMTAIKSSTLDQSFTSKSLEYLNRKILSSSVKSHADDISNRVRKCQSASELASSPNIESHRVDYNDPNEENYNPCRYIPVENTFKRSKSTKCQSDYISKTTYTGTGTKMHSPSKLKDALTNMYTNNSGIQKMRKSMGNLFSSTPSFTLPRFYRSHNSKKSSDYQSRQREFTPDSINYFV